MGKNNRNRRRQRLESNQKLTNNQSDKAPVPSCESSASSPRDQGQIRENRRYGSGAKHEIHSKCSTKRHDLNREKENFGAEHSSDESDEGVKNGKQLSRKTPDRGQRCVSATEHEKAGETSRTTEKQIEAESTTCPSNQRQLIENSTWRPDCGQSNSEKLQSAEKLERPQTGHPNKLQSSTGERGRSRNLKNDSDSSSNNSESASQPPCREGTSKTQASFDKRPSSDDYAACMSQEDSAKAQSRGLDASKSLPAGAQRQPPHYPDNNPDCFVDENGQPFDTVSRSSGTLSEWDLMSNGSFQSTTSTEDSEEIRSREALIADALYESTEELSVQERIGDCDNTVIEAESSNSLEPRCGGIACPEDIDDAMQDVDNGDEVNDMGSNSPTDKNAVTAQGEVCDSRTSQPVTIETTEEKSDAEVNVLTSIENIDQDRNKLRGDLRFRNNADSSPKLRLGALDKSSVSHAAAAASENHDNIAEKIFGSSSLDNDRKIDDGIVRSKARETQGVKHHQTKSSKSKSKKNNRANTAHINTMATARSPERGRGRDYDSSGAAAGSRVHGKAEELGFCWPQIPGIRVSCKCLIDEEGVSYYEVKGKLGKSKREDTNSADGNDNDKIAVTRPSDDEGDDEEGSLPDPDMVIKHPLQNSWAMWFFKNDKSKDWKDNLRVITTFDTVEDFWGLYNHTLPASRLQTGCDYSVFKAGIQPMWEDPQNKKGGRWLINLNKTQRQTHLDDFWLETLLCLIGEGFDEHSEDICGATVNIRTKGDKLGLWTRDASKTEATKKIGYKLKESLNVPSKIVIGFQAHSDTAGKAGSTVKNRFTV